LVFLSNFKDKFCAWNRDEAVLSLTRSWQKRLCACAVTWKRRRDKSRAIFHPNTALDFRHWIYFRSSWTDNARAFIFTSPVDLCVACDGIHCPTYRFLSQPTVRPGWCNAFPFFRRVIDRPLSWPLSGQTGRYFSANDHLETARRHDAFSARPEWKDPLPILASYRWNFAAACSGSVRSATDRNTHFVLPGLDICKCISFSHLRVCGHIIWQKKWMKSALSCCHELVIKFLPWWRSLYSLSWLSS
jgi:hypothetical protein